MVDGYQLDALIQQTLERFKIHFAAVVDSHRHHFGACLGGDHLPRHDIRVVLQRRHQHPITGAQIGSTPGSSHQIDGLSGAAGPDHLAR